MDIIEIVFIVAFGICLLAPIFKKHPPNRVYRSAYSTTFTPEASADSRRIRQFYAERRGNEYNANRQLRNEV